jgi:hypothetical protein
MTYTQKNRKTKQNIKKCFIIGLILTESIIMSCEKSNNKGDELAQKQIEKNDDLKTNNEFNKVKNSDLIYKGNPIIPIIKVYDKEEKPIFNLFCKSPQSNPKLIENGNYIYLVEMDKENVYVSKFDKNSEQKPLNIKISEQSFQIPEHKDNFPEMSVLRINDINIEEKKMKIKYSKNLKSFSSELEID